MNASNVKHVNFRQENPLERMARWFCLACEGDTFKLSALGDVYCASCRARVSTIQVVQKV